MQTLGPYQLYQRLGSGATAESIAIAVERAVMEFASGAPEDDVAIVVIRPTGDAAGLC